MKFTVILLFALVVATQSRGVASSGTRATRASVIAQKTIADAQGMADSVLGKVQADGSKAGSSFLEMSGSLSTAALMARATKVEMLAQTEREAIQAQQEALATMQQEQVELATREDDLERQPAVAHKLSTQSGTQPADVQAGPVDVIARAYIDGKEVREESSRTPSHDKPVPERAQATKGAFLRTLRASLQKDLDKANSDANRLKTQGDPIAKTVLQDLAPARQDLKLVAAQTAETMSAAKCIKVPVLIQVSLIGLFVVFAVLDHFMKNIVETEIHEHRHHCGMCVHMSRWTAQAHVYTIMAFFVWLLSMNGFWAIMCVKGVAQEFMEQIGIYSFMAFGFLGALSLFMMEIYLRYLASSVEKAKELEHSVSRLVGLLDVKYGKQLQEQTAKMQKATAEAGNAAWDAADDVTDFLGVTEGSSDEDVSCWNGCQKPKKKRNA